MQTTHIIDKPAPPPKRWQVSLCIKCGTEFNDEESYRQHKIQHLTQAAKAEGKAEKWIAKDLRASVNTQITPPATPVVVPKTEEKAAEPIAAPTLHYIYRGVCPTCMLPVDTLDLDVDIGRVDKRETKYVVVCWCNVCKKKIKQRAVLKL